MVPAVAPGLIALAVTRLPARSAAGLRTNAAAPALAAPSVARPASPRVAEAEATMSADERASFGDCHGLQMHGPAGALGRGTSG